MKTMLVALLALSASSAFAVGFNDDDGGVGAPSARYFSWCVKDSVMQEGRNGRPVRQFDCAASGQRCEQAERPLGDGSVAVYARCVSRR